MTSHDFYADAPLYTALCRYADKGMSSFHTPGHKGNASVLPLDLSLDLTELPETDSLFECDGIIRASEVRAASLFGAKSLEIVWKVVIGRMDGWLPAYIPPVSYVWIVLMIIVAYLVVMLIDYGRIRRIPMDEALKNVE